MPSARPPLPLGSEIAGAHRFRLHRVLGAGAFAAVYEASPVDGQPINGRTRFAAKVLGQEGGDQVLNLLKRELAALLALNSNRIPVVYDWGLATEFPFIIMELYPRGSLQDQLAMGEALGTADTWRLLHDLLEAIKVAHGAGILHLDIKPANVMLDGEGGYVLGDFGISQALRVLQGPAVTPSAGTPRFRAPEQARLDVADFDARTDLYAVGSTIWQAYVGDRRAAQAAPDRTPGHLPPLVQARPDADPALSRLVARLTTREPSLRPGSAAEVLAEMTSHFRSDFPPPPTMPGRFMDGDQVEQLHREIVDPLWAEILQQPDLPMYYVFFKPGEELCRVGELSYYAFVLLHGRVRIQRGAQTLAIESRQGTFLGEVAALTGTWRTASMVAEDLVFTGIMRSADLERFLADHPVVALRLLKGLAERLVRESMCK